MKRFVILVFGLFLCHAAAFGQGYIGVFADPEGTSCEFTEAFPGVLQVYIVHVDVEETTASQFMVYQSPRFAGVYLGQEAGQANVVVGNAPSGVDAAYGVCLSSPIHILTLSYYVDGTSDPCSYLEVVPNPLSPYGGIAMVDCNIEVIVLETGGRGNFNVAAAADPCDCSDPLAPVANELTTWGQVKALYQ